PCSLLSRSVPASRRSSGGHPTLPPFPTRRSSDLYGLILPLRGPRSAANYAKVWMQDGSPLLVYTRGLAERIQAEIPQWQVLPAIDRKSTRLNSSHVKISYAVFCLKKKKYKIRTDG